MTSQWELAAKAANADLGLGCINRKNNVDSTPGRSSPGLVLVRTQTKPGRDTDKARMGRSLGNSEEMWDPWEISE